MSEPSGDFEPVSRRTLDELDESIADPAWIEAKRRRQRYGNSTWIGIVVIGLIAAGFLAWRAYGSSLRRRADLGQNRVMESLGTE